MHQVGEPGSQWSSAAQVHQRYLIHQNSTSAWDTKQIIAMETESFIFSLYFLPLLLVFLLFSFPLQLSRQHLGVLWNKCYTLKAHHCLPERKMASYWKQHVMVIAVLLQVMPLKNIRGLFSSNWWWGKAQLTRKLTVALSFTQLQTPSYKCLVCCVHSCV